MILRGCVVDTIERCSVQSYCLTVVIAHGISIYLRCTAAVARLQNKQSKHSAVLFNEYCMIILLARHEQTYAPELFILESSADEAHGKLSTGSSRAASINRYSDSTSTLRTPETGVFSIHKRVPPIVDNNRSTQTGKYLLMIVNLLYVTPNNKRDCNHTQSGW